MSLTFTLGESWLIDIATKDGTGAVLSLVGATLSFKVGAPALLTATSPAGGIVIETPASGLALITITPAMQTAAGITAGVYPYEVRATLSDGTVTTQDEGSILILPSLF